MMDKDRAGRLNKAQGRDLVWLARKTIMEKLKIPCTLQAADPLANCWQDPLLQAKRGVFVTLHCQGQLRGCIGSLSCSTSIVEGVESNALNAAFKDFRFSPITADEFAGIDVEISILSDPKPLAYDGADDLVAALRPDFDGVIIKKDGASATFLPQVWSQLPDVEGFLDHLCLKAGLPADEWRQGELEVIIYQVQYFGEERRSST